MVLKEREMVLKEGKRVKKGDGGILNTKKLAKIKLIVQILGIFLTFRFLGLGFRLIFFIYPDPTKIPGSAARFTGIQICRCHAV